MRGRRPGHGADAHAEPSATGAVNGRCLLKSQLADRQPRALCRARAQQHGAENGTEPCESSPSSTERPPPRSAALRRVQATVD